MGIEELIAKRAELINSAKKFLEEHSSEDGILSAEDAAEYDKIEAKIVDLGKEIDRRKRLEEIDNQAGSTVMRPPLIGMPANSGDTPEKSRRASNEYKNAMLAAMRTGFRQVSNLLQESVAADGGYLVPDEWDAQIVEALEENNIMRDLADVIKTENDHKITIAGNDPEAAWLDEGQKMVSSDMHFDQVVIDAYKLGAAVPVTEELLADACYDVQGTVTRGIGRAMGRAEEDKFLNGDGTKGPTGIFDTTAGGEEAVTLDGDITSDGLLDLIYSLKKPYRKNAAFIMHDNTIRYIRHLKDGDGRFLWVESLVAGEPDRLMGYPIYTSSKCPTNKIAFGDYRYYKIGDRGQRTINRYNEIGALEGQIYFTGKERVDGKLTMKEAVQILTFSPTKVLGIAGKSSVPVMPVPETTTTATTTKTTSKK